MALISMKIPDENEISEPNEYGYGLCIRLNPGQVKALGITELPKAGSAMMITASAIANRVTEEADDDQAENEIYLELQITDMELKPSKSVSENNASAATLLYGGDSD
jgi:hypothetical protein